MQILGHLVLFQIYEIPTKNNFNFFTVDHGLMFPSAE